MPNKVIEFRVLITAVTAEIARLCFNYRRFKAILRTFEITSKNKKFTLLEIIIAMAVLTLSLTGLLQLLTSSQLRIAHTQEKWQYMHMLSQAAEYLLMQNEQNLDIPEDFFNYPGYHINCSYEEADGLPEEFKNQENQLPLKKCTIELIRESDNKVVDSLIIDRLSYDEDSK